MPNDLFVRLHTALLEREPVAKCDLVAGILADWHAGILLASPESSPALPISDAGRPELPELVPPEALPRRDPRTEEGRAALAHALAHIEFTAINLALDAAYRFRELPERYHSDWLTVAAEEAQHFLLLQNHLYRLGHAYGDFPAHGGLWDMAVKTADDPLARMALVPRLLEARGLDATPPIRAKFKAAGDMEMVEILRRIERDEVTHVAIGDRWFRFLCSERRLSPESTFQQLVRQFRAPWPKPPFNVAARLTAGFSEAELHAFLRGS